MGVVVRRVGTGQVGFDALGADTPGEHVLDGDLDAVLGARRTDDVEEAGGVFGLPPERRVHHDALRAEATRELGALLQLDPRIAAPHEVRE